MHVNDIADSAMWATAVTDGDAVEHRGLVVKATVALAGTWPFLAAAKSMEEFEHRLALMQEQIEARTPAEIRTEVVAGLREKFAAMQEERLTTTAMLRTAARTIASADGEGSLPQAYVHVHKHGSGDDEYHQIDYIAGPTYLQTIARSGDRDDALTKAREYALPNGLPLYENGRYVEGKLLQPGEEFLDSKTGRWVKVAHQSWTAGGTALSPFAGIADEAARARRDANWGTHLAAGDPTAVNRAPGVTNYQPDPDMAWRYRYPVPEPTEALGGQPSAPGSGSVVVPQQAAGSSIGADGFPIDVAQGEYAGAAAKIQEVLTPGQWTVTPGTEWPVRPNAGHQGQEQVFASRKVAEGGWGLSETAQPGGGAFTHVVRSHFGPGQSPVDHFVGSEQEGDAVRQHHLQLGAQQSHVFPIGVHNSYAASRRTATEGAAPTPGPNPNYFSQGTQGLQGPAQFPENPSQGIEPKVSPHIDEGMFDNPPPVPSSGSAQGLVDGGGYSRNAAKKHDSAHLTMNPAGPEKGYPSQGHEVHMHHGDDHFQVGWWPTEEAARKNGEDYGRAYGFGAPSLGRKPVTFRTARRERPFGKSAGERTAAGLWDGIQHPSTVDIVGKGLYPYMYASGTKAHDVENRFGTETADGYRDAQHHATQSYDWRTKDPESFAHVPDDYQFGYHMAHDDMRAEHEQNKPLLEPLFHAMREQSTPEEMSFLRSNPTGPSKWSARHSDIYGREFWDPQDYEHRRETCTACGGEGSYGTGRDERNCPNCDGNGHIDVELAPGDPGHSRTAGMNDPAFNDQLDRAWQGGAMPSFVTLYHPEKGDGNVSAVCHRCGPVAEHPDDNLVRGLASEHNEAHQGELFDLIHGAGAHAREFPWMYQGKRKQASGPDTDGRIVGNCDHCNRPVRYHQSRGGHLRHLHSDSPYCADGKAATAMRVTQGGVEYRLPIPKESALRKRAADFFRAYPRSRGGDCSFCGGPATHDLAHVTDGTPHKVGDACTAHAGEYDGKRATGAVLENPTADNPSGRGGDPYRSKTQWEGFEQQRPRQQLEGQSGMNANTPTTPPEPIKGGPNVNTPTTGAEDDEDDKGPRERDDDDQ